MLETPGCDSQQSPARVQGAFQVYDQVNLRAPPKMAPPESCPPASSHGLRQLVESALRRAFRSVVSSSSLCSRQSLRLSSTALGGFHG